MTTQHPDNSSITQVPGQEDLVANVPGYGPTYVPVNEDAEFVKPKGRVGATVALGASMSIDNSEGGVSKVFFPQIMNAFAVNDTALGLINSLYAKSERGKAFGTVRGISAGLGMLLTPALGQFGDNPNGWRYSPCSPRW